MELGTHFSRRDALRVGALGVCGCLVRAGVGTRVGAQPASSPAGTNWAGNVRFSAKEFQRPAGVAELQQFVRQRPRVHAVGGRHSFSPIADTDGTLLSLDRFNQIVVDRDAGLVDVGAGVKYSDLCPVLQSQGFAVENLASLPHIGVVGACATATHGSGTQNLAASVEALDLVNGAGELVTLARGDAEFSGAVVGLGAMGIVTQMTLRLKPAFEVRQWVWENMPLDALAENFDEIFSAGYSVSGFTTWRDDSVSEVWVKRLADDGDWEGERTWFEATAAPRDRHPIVTMDAAPCTVQMGIAGPAWERLPHFRPDHPPSSKGRERHSEYMVDRRHAVDAIRALYEVGEQIAKALQISEIRTVKADDLWMSTAYERDCACLHFTWTDNDPDVLAAMPIVEAAVRPFAPRPHWGKMHTLAPEEVAAQYPKLEDFRQLCRRHDPEGKFRNAYLEKYVFSV
jgi:alditol oxidase